MPVVSSTSDVDKPEVDERLYRHVVLDNGIRALLISDAETERAACAVGIGVGSWSDFYAASRGAVDGGPIWGLAHFVEHMVFLGTEKFPEESYYTKFLGKNGGTHNAFTAHEQTQFIFDVNPKALEECLSIFSDFFKKPLFEASCTDRELNAVNSEDQMNQQSDPHRTLQILRSLAEADHPFSGFSTGNLKTLKEETAERGLDPRTLCMALHEASYSSDLMNIALVGTESLDELEALLSGAFSDVPNRGKPRPVAAPPAKGRPFATNSRKHLRILPVKEKKSLELYFDLSPVVGKWKAGVDHYVSDLVAGEGEGSLCSYLKNMGWANALSGGLYVTHQDCASWLLQIDLTAEGLGRIDDIVEAFFAYVKLLKEVGPQQWKHDENVALMGAAFRFQASINPYDYVSSLVDGMTDRPDVPPKLTLSANKIPVEFDAAAIAGYLDEFVPDRMIVVAASKAYEAECTLQEKWYGTKYADVPVSAATLATWADPPANPALKMPEPNPFVATDFSLRAADVPPPAAPSAPLSPRSATEAVMADASAVDLLIEDRDSTAGVLWHKLDRTFKRPLVQVNVLIHTPVVCESVESLVLASLWTKLVSESLNEYSYPAALASLTYSLSHCKLGIWLQFSGYSDKMPVLVKKVVENMRNPKLDDEATFARIKDLHTQEHANYDVKAPYQHCMWSAMFSLESPRWSPAQKLVALEALTLTDVRAFTARLLKRGTLETFVHGNATAAESRSLHALVSDGLAPMLPLLQSQAPTLSRIVRLPPRSHELRRVRSPNKAEANNACAIWLQIGPNSAPTLAAMNLINQILADEAFQQLRTVEQLGYAVWTNTETMAGRIVHWRFLMQSPSHAPHHCDARVEAFMVQARDCLADMSEADFAEHVASRTRLLLEKDKNMSGRASRLWSEVLTHTYDWRRKEKEVEALAALSKADVLAFYDAHIAADAAERRKFAVHVYGNTQLMPGEDACEGVVQAADADAAGDDGEKAAEEGGAEADGDAVAAAAAGEDAKPKKVYEAPAYVDAHLFDDPWTWKRSMDLYALS